MTDKWWDMQPHWDELSRIAQARDHQKRGYQSTKNWSKHSTHFLGLVGEMAYSLLTGIPVDVSLKACGDIGRDFVIDGKTVDVKAVSHLNDPHLKQYPRPKSWADIYVLAGVDTNLKRCKIFGQCSRQTMQGAGTRDYGYGPMLSLTVAELDESEERMTDDLLTEGQSVLGDEGIDIKTYQYSQYTCVECGTVLRRKYTKDGSIILRGREQSCKGCNVNWTVGHTTLQLAGVSPIVTDGWWDTSEWYTRHPSDMARLTYLLSIGKPVDTSLDESFATETMDVDGCRVYVAVDDNLEDPTMDIAYDPGKVPQPDLYVLVAADVAHRRYKVLGQCDRMAVYSASDVDDCSVAFKRLRADQLDPPT